jgi:hypothetical protein
MRQTPAHGRHASRRLDRVWKPVTDILSQVVVLVQSHQISVIFQISIDIIGLCVIIKVVICIIKGSEVIEKRVC